MATRSAIRTSAFSAISQTEGSADVSTAEMNGFIDEGVRFLAPLIKWPRKFDVLSSITSPALTAGTSKYALFTDAILIRTAYFGDKTISGDVRPLDILTEEALESFRPNWLEQTSQNQGTPKRIILYDRSNIWLDPAPATADVAAGKQLLLGYVYLPADLSGDSSSPDLPTTYHDLVTDYAIYKCYNGKLNNSAEAERILQSILSRSKILEPVITKEMEQIAMAWGNADNLDDDGMWGIKFY